jgi:hypothetical protein
VNGDAILKKAMDPFERTPLFRWLFENHEQMKAVAAERRLEWTVLCQQFAAQGLTDATGRTPSPSTARKTWFRVRREKKRVEERERRELAEREARRAADPRRNMPSRFPKGEYGPPLSNVQPAAQSRALGPAPRQALAAGSATSAATFEHEYWHDLVLPECLKDMRVLDWDNALLDLRQFFRNDGVPEPWDDPNLDPQLRVGEMKIVIWSRAKDWSRHLPYDRKNRSKW